MTNRVRKPIDIICQGLQEAGIEYSSTMVSNGYLLNAQTVEKAVNSWKLQKTVSRRPFPTRT